MARRRLRAQVISNVFAVDRKAGKTRALDGPEVPRVVNFVHARRVRQNESELMTSLPLAEPRDCQTPGLVAPVMLNGPCEAIMVTPGGRQVPSWIGQLLIVSLMKRTEPSHIATFNPPGWKLDAPATK